MALAGAVTGLMHAVPIGIVQFADYASERVGGSRPSLFLGAETIARALTFAFR